VGLSVFYLLLASASTPLPPLSYEQGIVATVAVRGRVEGSCHARVPGNAAPMHCNVPSVRIAYATNDKGSFVFTIRPAF
jgi:hypothetical protein